MVCVYPHHSSFRLLFDSYFLFTTTRKEGTFVTGVITKFSFQISATMVCTIISHLVGLLAPVKEKVVPDPETKVLLPQIRTFEELLASQFIGVAYIISVFLIKNIILFSLNFNVHISYYSERIKQNTEKINLLRKLVFIVNSSYSEPPREICSNILPFFQISRIIW